MRYPAPNTCRTFSAMMPIKKGRNYAMQDWNPEFINMLVSYGLNALAAVVTLVVGWTIAGWAGSSVRKQLEKSATLDPTLAIIVGKLCRLLILLLTLIAVLNYFGIQTASIIALLGAAGLAVGLALQGALSNVAAGIMLLVLRPFKVGDLVDFGVTGTVDEIGIFVTRMHTIDNIAMTVPNAQIWGSAIKNFAHNPTRRIDMVFGIGYGDDMGKAVRLIQEVIAGDERFLKDPEPMVAVAELADSSVNIYARPWVNRADYFATKLDFTRKVKERFDAAGISIPFPQRDVHLFQQEAKAA
jgi:small conductance mechanosensitive channel